MVQLLYFGRLDQEKGRDAIIAMIEYFSDTETKTLPFVVHIFGKGSYEKKVCQLAEQFPQHIIYYGFQPLEKVKKTAKSCDYCLMPSLFLETFGLSAVNALARGLPVIGYQQGGMTPFVIDDYNLSSNPGLPDVQLVAMTKKLLTKGRHGESKKCQNIAKEYNKQQRINNFNKMLNPSLHEESKKILLVTDFMNKLGGIETYVHDIATLLQEQGHTVQIIGSSGGKTKYLRIVSMFISLWNIFFAWKLHKKIKAFDPDIIRCHSVLRHIGWLGLRTINKSPAQKWMMYHDLGYFHPFPHQVTQEKQIARSLDWKDFSASIHSPIEKFFVWGKRLLLKKIQKQLRQFDQHLVPSDFMQEAVVKNYNNKPTTLSHFIQD